MSHMIPPMGTTDPVLSSTGYLLVKAGHHIGLTFDAKLAVIGLSVREYLVLGFVDTTEALSQQELSERLGIDPTIVVGLVDALEDRSLLVRTRDPADRRRNILAVTPLGAEVHASAIVAGCRGRGRVPRPADASTAGGAAHLTRRRDAAAPRLAQPLTALAWEADAVTGAVVERGPVDRGTDRRAASVPLALLVVVTVAVWLALARLGWAFVTEQLDWRYVAEQSRVGAPLAVPRRRRVGRHGGLAPAVRRHPRCRRGRRRSARPRRRPLGGAGHRAALCRHRRRASPHRSGGSTCRPSAGSG